MELKPKSSPPDQAMLDQILDNPGPLLAEAKFKTGALCCDILCTHNCAALCAGGIPACIPCGIASAYFASKAMADSRTIKVHQNKLIMHQRFKNAYCCGTDACILESQNAAGYVVINTSDIKSVKKAAPVPCSERYSNPNGGCFYLCCICCCVPCCCPYADRFNFSGLDVEAEPVYNKGWTPFLYEINKKSDGSVGGMFLRHLSNQDEIYEALLKVAGSPPVAASTPA